MFGSSPPSPVSVARFDFIAFVMLATDPVKEGVKTSDVPATPELRLICVYPWLKVYTIPVTFVLGLFATTFILLILPLQSGQNNPSRFVAQFSAAQLVLLAISVRLNLFISCALYVPRTRLPPASPTRLNFTLLVPLQVLAHWRRPGSRSLPPCAGSFLEVAVAGALELCSLGAYVVGAASSAEPFNADLIGAAVLALVHLWFLSAVPLMYLNHHGKIAAEDTGADNNTSPIFYENRGGTADNIERNKNSAPPSGRPNTSSACVRVCGRGLVFVAFGLITFEASSMARAQTASALTAVGEFLDMPVSWEGGAVHMYCTGAAQEDASVTFVFIHGYGGCALDTLWAQRYMVLEYADLRYCAFDRPGHGWSQSGPPPRSAGATGAEYATFMKAGRIEGPVIAVAHSLGNYNLMAFVRHLADSGDDAQAFTVRGAVIVDGMDPNWEGVGVQNRPISQAFCDASALSNCDPATCGFWKFASWGVPWGISRLLFAVDAFGFRTFLSTQPADMLDRYISNGLKLKYAQTRVEEGMWWRRSCGEAVWGDGDTFEGKLGVSAFHLEVIACGGGDGWGINSTRLTRLSARNNLVYLPDVTHTVSLVFFRSLFDRFCS